ncbi:hypothetical protein [Mesomycoplasma ovipneumoniae]
MASKDGIIKSILAKFTPYMPKHNILFNVYGQPINDIPLLFDITITRICIILSKHEVLLKKE